MQETSNLPYRAKVTYAMFNNCHGGFAIKDALRLKELLALKERIFDKGENFC
jgi:uncharacterized protein YecE (DUF72 family)